MQIIHSLCNIFAYLCIVQYAQKQYAIPPLCLVKMHKSILPNPRPWFFSSMKYFFQLVPRNIFFILENLTFPQISTIIIID
jgi:hypothetical protein